MKRIWFILFMFLVSCNKDDYQVNPNSSAVSPYSKYVFKTIESSGVLKIKVLFNDDCRYPILRDECEGDWNKLIYYGDWNPHNSGAAFVWKPEGTDRHLIIGYYLWYNHVAPFVSGTYHKVMDINTNTWYFLEIDLTDGIKWFINDTLVMQYTDKTINGRFISQGWFGGADDSGNNCNAPQKITYEIKKLK